MCIIVLVLISPMIDCSKMGESENGSGCLACIESGSCWFDHRERMRVAGLPSERAVASLPVETVGVATLPVERVR